VDADCGCGVALVAVVAVFATGAAVVVVATGFAAGAVVVGFAAGGGAVTFFAGTGFFASGIVCAPAVRQVIRAIAPSAVAKWFIDCVRFKRFIWLLLSFRC
jgi:hypothetical protein